MTRPLQAGEKRRVAESSEPQRDAPRSRWTGDGKRGPHAPRRLGGGRGAHRGAFDPVSG